MRIKINQINLFHIFCIVGVGLLLTTPAMIHGIFGAHDLVTFHLKWSKHFADQLWQGDFYPRWLMNMNSGLGGPSFFFYAPIPYYFTGLFKPLFPHDTSGWYQLLSSSLLALIASGVTAYVWLKSLTNQNSAFTASILYMALPYHLTVDFYWRFAFAEYWTFVWLPLIFYFSKKLINNVYSIIGFALSYALLIMTHLPTLIIFSPVIISYILLMAGKGERKKVLIRMAVALLLGIGLSAIYWLPAMLTQEYISMSSIMTGKYFYENLFLFSGPSYDHEKIFWRYLEVITLLMGGIAYCAFLIIRRSPLEAPKIESRYWIFVAVIALFMTLPLSEPVWDILPVLQRVQFSWRFNTVLTVSTTALLALASSYLNPVFEVTRKRLCISILLIVSIVMTVIQILPLKQEYLFPGQNNTILWIVVTAILVIAVSSLKRPVNLSRQKNFYIVVLLIMSLLLSGGIVSKKRLFNPSDVDTAIEISMDAPEYRPRWVSPEIFQPDTVSKLGRSSAKALVTVGQGSVLVQSWNPRKIVLQANVTTDAWLTINQFFYPGWTARLRGETYFLPLQPSKPEGLLRVEVPRGRHEVVVTLDTGVEERIGQIISAISALITLLFLFWFHKSRRSNINHELIGISR